MKSIAVLGLGKVGHLAAHLLHEADFQVFGYDLRRPAHDTDFPVNILDTSSEAELGKAFASVDAVLSCLPYHLNKGVANAAHKAGIHYFDLTEDVPTTNHIIELSKTSKGLMAPQCGLAPGFVGIVGAAKVNEFDKCRSLKMRVWRTAAEPDRIDGLCIQLVSGRRCERVSQRLRSH